MNETKFEKKGEIYTKFRPSYPQEFISYLYDNVGLTKESVIADIGAGTGKLTKEFLERGNKTFLVEPNDDMRAVAEKELGMYENLVSVKGSAENTELKNGNIDFITVAQAFHWFNAELFKKECKRVLKKGGKVILVWNSRDPESEETVACDKINKQYCENYKGFSGGMQWESSVCGMKQFFSGEYETKFFKNNLLYDEESFIGRQLSASYALKEDDEKYESYISAYREVFSKYSKKGIITLNNTTRVYIGEV